MMDIVLARSPWLFLSQRDCLWLQVLEAKYGNIWEAGLGNLLRSASYS